MNIKNENILNSLRCLQHPVTWLSIALLVVNDHILKVVYPSWITGKLSDFAGLFFFPFIVAAGLSFLLSKYKISSSRIGLLAFGIVGIWFALLKTYYLILSIVLSEMIDLDFALVNPEYLYIFLDFLTYLSVIPIFLHVHSQIQAGLSRALLCRSLW